MENTITSAVVGCDLGDKHSEVCVLNDVGEVVERARVATSEAGFRRWFSKRAAITVVVEVGTHSRWVEQLLRQLGHQVWVANARQVRLIHHGRRKSDRLDAEKLARLARADVRLLGPIQHRGPRAHNDLVVLRCRDQLVRSRTELVNHLRGITKSFGLRVASCESSTFPRRAREVLPTTLAVTVEPILVALEAINEQIKSYDKKVEDMAAQCAEAQAVLSIRGVGPVTAMAFIRTLEDPRRFRRSRDVAAFLGLVPRQWQTGQSDPQLRITKCGDAFVRGLLVNCAHHILGPFGRDSDLRTFGRNLMARGGKNAKKKAVIAVARKLAVLMHRLWISGETYVPLHLSSAAA